MSGTDRQDSSDVGLKESAAVRAVLTAPDGCDYFIEKERAVLKKFDGDWTDEQMSSGEAEQAGALCEVIVLEDGQVVDRWHRGEERDAPG